MADFNSLYDRFYRSHRAAMLWTAAYRITGDRSHSDSAVDEAWARFREMDDESRGRAYARSSSPLTGIRRAARFLRGGGPF